MYSIRIDGVDRVLGRVYREDSPDSVEERERASGGGAVGVDTVGYVRMELARSKLPCVEYVVVAMN